jgi:hypothetical protein
LLACIMCCWKSCSTVISAMLSIVHCFHTTHYIPNLHTPIEYSQITSCCSTQACYILLRDILHCRWQASLYLPISATHYTHHSKTHKPLHTYTVQTTVESLTAGVRLSCCYLLT